MRNEALAVTFTRNDKEILDAFTAWWNHEDIGRPLVKVCGMDGETVWPQKLPDDNRVLHMDADFRFRFYAGLFSNVTFFGEAFPFIDLNMGPGSMAAYLGAQPMFERDTVWYRNLVENSLDELGELRFDPEQFWWKEHLAQVKKVTELAQGSGIWTTIPDILENLDILSLLRSPSELCYDLIDEPEAVARYIESIDRLYFHYYDAMYDLVKRPDGSSSFTAFSILSRARTAKLQCDFSAMLSPAQYRDFIVPSLERQIGRREYVMYHLDGVDATRHIDAVLGLRGLRVLQWEPGAGKPDCGDERWYPLYDKAFEAGKSLWLSIGQGTVDDFMEKSRRLVRRYGTRGLYLLYPNLPLKDAQKLYACAENGFR